MAGVKRLGLGQQAKSLKLLFIFILATIAPLILHQASALAAGAPTVAGVWSATGSLAAGRSGHTATLLPNGTVLVAGGYSTSTGFLNSSALYDPATELWSPTTGPLGTARGEHTATLLPNGKVLVAGGTNGSFVGSAEIYDPGTGTWTATGSMATARQGHTATLLPNGKVLVAGGLGSAGALTSAEIFDPAANSGAGGWSSTGSLSNPRQNHTATLLPNGKVLAAGGKDSGGNHMVSAELFDPGTNTWSGTGNLHVARSFHTATLLPNGKVLAAGGQDRDDAELYNPADGTWTQIGYLSSGTRGYHTATLLPNGTVLLAGGDNGVSSLNSAELYDPIPGTFGATGSLAGVRKVHTATLLPNGIVLVAGGTDGTNSLNSCEVYASPPATWTAAAGFWVATGSLANGRESSTTTLLPNGNVLVAGGKGSVSGAPLNTAALYDPVTGTWTTTGNLAAARTNHTATLLPNGRVLVAGGGGASGALVSAELYNPATGTWTATGSLNAARMYHTATLLPNGKVLAAGGNDGSGNVLASAELYDPATSTWTTIASTLYEARYNHTATLLPNGKVLVAGGYNVQDFSMTSAEIYDPDINAWTYTSGGMSAPRSAHTATLLPNGKVLMAGGYDSVNSLTLDSADLYDTATGYWSSTGPLGAARQQHTATLLPNGLVLVAGGRGISAPFNSAELYDPAAGTWAAASSLNGARVYHTATLLPNGLVLAVGGDDGSGGALASAELYGVFHYINATAGPNGAISPAGTVAAEDGLSKTFTITPNAGFQVANVLVDGPSVGAVTSYTFPNVTTTHTIDASFAPGDWSATGNLNTGRRQHTATLLLDGKVLVTGGANGLIPLNSTELYDPGTGLWTVAATFGARSQHTATLLPNGKVLVAGGIGPGGLLNSAQLYDPGTGTWAATGSLNYSRMGHTATLLSNGQVLVTGGYDTVASLNTAELYNPDTGTWTTTAPLSTVRTGHTATLLANGQVLVAGGFNFASGVATSLAELYDPATGNWSPTNPLNTARHGHTATLLPSGRVLVAGGDGALSAELYDPGSGIWTATGSLITNRSNHTATLLPNGRVLVAGGQSAGALASSEVYDPYAGNWTSTLGPLATPRVNHTATLLPSGKVLAAGGMDGIIAGSSTDLNTAELYGPSATLLFNIAATSGAHGVIWPCGPVLVNYGVNQTFTITPQAGYQVANVFVGGVSQGPLTTYTFTYVSGDSSISATFAPITHTITASAGAGGSISPNGAVSVADGANQGFTITPNTGYHVSGLVVDGNPVTPATSYTFNNVITDHTIAASFALDTFTISASVGAGGTISPSGAVSVNYGSSQGFSITANTGYHIADVTVDGVSQGAVSSYNFSTVTANHTIAASFALNTFTITASAGGGGSISPSGAVSVNYGSSQGFSITAITGYHIADVTVDGVSQGAVSSYNFSTVTANHTIAASFALNTFTITASAGAGGTISPSGAVSVNYGSNQTFYITPNTGYYVSGLIVDGSPVTPATSYTFSNVTAGHTIIASFATGSYTITASAGTGGTISPSGTISVGYGSSRNFTITPNSGYHVADVLVDGSSVGAKTFYTFSNVTTNHTIAASFAMSLAFPLPGYTATTAPVSAVMDNSVLERTPVEFYVPGNVIKAFNGEIGEKQYGYTYLDSYGKYWPAYKNSSGTNFFPPNGAGTRPLNYLNGPYLSYAGIPGYNYQVPQGTPVLATADGRLYKVVTDLVNGAGYSYYYSSYIDHQNGYYSWYLYAPLSSAILTEIKQKGYAQVTSGQVIGQTTGDHLHFEVRLNGFDHANVVDPYKLGMWLKPGKQQAMPWIQLLLLN